MNRLNYWRYKVSSWRINIYLLIYGVILAGMSLDSPITFVVCYAYIGLIFYCIVEEYEDYCYGKYFLYTKR